MQLVAQVNLIREHPLFLNPPTIHRANRGRHRADGTYIRILRLVGGTLFMMGM